MSNVLVGLLLFRLPSLGIGWFLCIFVFLFLAFLFYVVFFFVPVCFPKGWQYIIPRPQFVLIRSGFCFLSYLLFYNKHLMTGLEGNSEFFEGNKIHCSPRDQSLSDLLYSKTKQKQNLKTALRFQPSRATAVNSELLTS